MRFCFLSPNGIFLFTFRFQSIFPPFAFFKTATAKKHSFHSDFHSHLSCHATKGRTREKGRFCGNYCQSDFFCWWRILKRMENIFHENLLCVIKSSCFSKLLRRKYFLASEAELLFLSICFLFRYFVYDSHIGQAGRFIIYRGAFSMDY